MLYPIIEFISRISLWIFFRRTEVHQAPETKGPVLFACNHPNMLLDPLLLGTTCGRQVNFLAKSTLFENRLLRWILSNCRVIPVCRAKDNPSNMDNKAAFISCYETLERGEAIGIFPEGVSHSESYIMSLKTGIARIALEAEERNDFSLGVKIVPVGLNFRRREKFRSSVFVVYGEPIELDDYIEIYRQDKYHAVRRLTQRVQCELENLTVSIKNKEDAEFIKNIEDVYRRDFWRADADGKKVNRFLRRLLFKQTLANAYEHFSQQEPEKAQLLRKVMSSYVQMAEQSQLPLGIAGYDISPMQAFVYCLKKLPLLILGLPVAIYGFVNHLLSYCLPQIAARRCQYLEEVATTKLLTGIVALPSCYLLQTWLVYTYSDWTTASLYLASLPVTLWLTLKYAGHLTLFLRSARIYWSLVNNKEVREKLARRRKLMLKFLNSLLRRKFKVTRQRLTENHEQPPFDESAIIA